MAKGICRNSSLGCVVELSLKEVEPSLIVLDDIIIVGTTFVMFNKSTANNLPVLGLEELLDLGLGLGILFIVPSLEEAHFAVHE